MKRCQGHSCPRLQSSAGEIPTEVFHSPIPHPLPHPPRFTAPIQGKSEKPTEAPHPRQRERGWEGKGKIGRDEEREKAGDPVKFPR